MILPTELRGSANAGFTLIEMIVVLVVMGLMIGLVMTHGPMRSPTVEARAAASRVMQGLRTTRAQAIASDHAVFFTVDSSGHTFRIGTGVPQALPKGVDIGLEIGGRIARGIGFAPDGSSAGGTILLANATRRMVVSVDWLTGRIGVADASP